MKNKRSLWISLLSVVGIVVIALSATLAAGWSPKLGLDLDGGLAVVYQTHTSVNSAELDTIVTILNNRVNTGTTGATVDSQGKNQISVSIPGAKNSQQILKTLGNTGQLFFRPALCYAPSLTVAKGQTPNTGPLPTACAPTSALSAGNLKVNTSSGQATATPPPDPQFAPYPTTTSENDAVHSVVLLPGTGAAAVNGRYVLGPAGLSGTGVHSATAQLQTGQWVVNMQLNGQGSSAWDTLAAQQFHAIIAIDLDGQVISAPITQPSQQSPTGFGGQVQISGNFTEDQAKALATDLNFGALPVKLDRLTVQTVSPTLGKASLQAGLLSGLAGLALVMLYMIFYYRILGVVVVAGLAVTGAALWAIIAIMGQTLGTTIDLAGIIGIIVSVGITVDSYIVYFERLKDEARSGRTIRSSVDKGFASAFRTVLAADAVSLLGAAILYFISVGPVKGFALFLGISTILDVVLTYTFTRPFVILLGQRRGGGEVSTMSMASGLGVPAATQ
ncbi:MAG TPA: protein translocase subunit SecD [Acidimicrobiales bacterium]|nr:protein translocase subunit SecD [Acidimicrobiales bacterium]